MYRQEERSFTDSQNKDYIARVEVFDSEYSWLLFLELVELLSPGVDIIKSLSDGKLRDLFSKDMKALDFSAISNFLFKLSSSNKVKNLPQRLLLKTTFGTYNLSNRDQYKEVFAGEIPLLIKVMAFVLEVNYKNFFGGGDIGEILSGISQYQTPNSEKE
jgi:hypothetical protein